MRFPTTCRSSPSVQYRVAGGAPDFFSVNFIENRPIAIRFSDHFTYLISPFMTRHDTLSTRMRHVRSQTTMTVSAVISSPLMLVDGNTSVTSAEPLVARQMSIIVVVNRICFTSLFIKLTAWHATHARLPPLITH